MGSAPGRRKSCAPCRVSKARCSLESPCRRCEERNLDCKYDHTPKRLAAYRALRPLPALEDLNQPSSYFRLLARDGSTPVDLPTGTQDDSIGDASMNWDALLSPSFLHPSSTYGLSWPRNRQQSDALDDQGTLLSLGSPEPLHSAKTSQLLTQSESDQPPAPLPLYQIRPLAPRGMNNAVASCFTVKVLLGQLLAYPRMMAKGGRLPPFIFPPCCMEGYRLPADSCRKEFHKCLPETLAICCNLVQSFESRTAGSTSFVWKSIYNEVERIQCEHASYDYKELLQGLQAVLIYLLLQAGDQDSIPENDIMTLLKAPILLARALHVACDYRSSLTSSTKVDRQEWVIRESIRRTICIIFGIELLLDVDFNFSAADCVGYSKLPLPAGRDLWETVSNDEWAARYSKLHAQSRSDRVLSIDDLRQARRAIGVIGVETTDMSEEGRLVAQVTKWCESLDELGMMVWMAVMLES
ncbi:hypothetical protein LZ31DRAFT_521110 [Colletotrichum somersetense]|nr:hypothetical protein LZ31DRAFT_521110 [Colletotrichum somersetense]